MATLKQKIAAERRARAMLEDNGVPQPDVVEYGYTCIRLIWEEEKVVLVVEIDKPPEGFEVIGDYLSDLGEEAA
ncbi:MAG TPA: hypothetical protein VKR21_02110 [Solirubrobacteraceae bacterium]|nr:hypothetical protein [Solirubrobacteraceae bacterium]